MHRPRPYTIAAVLLALLCLISLLFEIPNLARGATPTEDAPPFPLVILNFILAVLTGVAAYGVWRVQKWGVLLGVVICGLSILTTLPAILFAPSLALRVAGVLGIVGYAAIIVLLLRPTDTAQRSGLSRATRGGQPTAAGRD